MKIVVVISTGGTIASRFDPSKGRVVASARGEDLLAALGDVSNIASVEVDEFATVASFDMTVEFALSLAQRVNTVGARDDVHGIVITHGTDTLEETSFLIALLQQHDKPVIMTGAQLAGDHPQSDGPRNLRNAIIAATCDELTGFRALVGFNGELHSARYVTKTHTSALETFQSPGAGPVGIVDKGRVYLNGATRPSPLPRFSITALDQRVDLIKTHLGMDDVLVKAAVAGGAKGLVIEGSGLGNVTAGLAPTLKALAQGGLPVLVTSRCLMGRAEPVYGSKGGSGGRDLEDAGCLFTGDLKGPKTRVLLMIALAAQLPLDGIKDLLRKVAP